VNQRRVAFFTDSFHEVNGVALTSREYVNHARRHSLPLFSVHAGPSRQVVQEGSVQTFEFQRSGVRWNLEHDLGIDLLFLRYLGRLRKVLRDFAPDLVHITGPGDAGILGALLAHQLHAPLAASWHTNLHEFAARRLPPALGSQAASFAERKALDMCIRFYRLAKVLFAPNQELVNLLATRTGRPVFLMSRGIDVDLFSPSRRNRSDGRFIIGYVGRLSPEKNVRLFAQLERVLVRRGWLNYGMLLVGEGSERDWLRHNLRRGELPGVLRGGDLARAYASMDAFVFPSTTDTFGNVVLEAMASGVPALVTSAGGPKFLVDSGRTGFVVDGVEGFASALSTLRDSPETLSSMRVAARKAVQQFSWDAVFEKVHKNYDGCFRGAVAAPGASSSRSPAC
jgi:glycosyltransferase involved in cell wall biosynthesis